MILKNQDVASLAQSSPPAAAKVLHLINGEHFSGAERVQDLLAMALPEFGYHAGFACLKPDKFPKVRNSVDSEIFTIKMRNKFDIFCSNQVTRIFKEHDYQLIHAHTPRSLMIAARAAKAIGCPLVYHVHSPVGRDSAKSFNNRINSWIEKQSLRRVNKLICVSNSLARYMIEMGHDAERVSVVSNGVAIEDNVVMRPQPNSPWTLGTMALFRPRKGTEVLLDAVALLKERGTTVNVRAVGPFETTEYQREIMQQIERLGIGSQIEWTGFKKDVRQQLQQMDVFVLPSLYGEGLPMVVLEAMANAIPVIASDVEGIPEAVRDNVDGMIFEPGSPESLAEKIKAMTQSINHWREMQSSAYIRQRECLSDKSMAEGVAAIYDQLLR